MANDDERLEFRKEILGGFAVYGLLAVCALFSLLPALLSGGFPEPPGAEGKSFVVTFFSLDDSSSPDQIDHLKRLRARFSDDSVDILALCVSPANPEDLASFAKAMGAPFPMLMCSKDLAKELREKRMVPFTLIWDREREKSVKISGFASSDDIALKVERMLR